MAENTNTPNSSPNSIYYTSRSAHETYQRCPRRRYLEYHHRGIGLTPSGTAIPLVTGSVVHEGVGAMLECTKAFNVAPNELFHPVDNFYMLLSIGVNTAKKAYQQILDGHTLQGRGTQTEAQQQFRIQEQFTLAAAMMYVWAFYELPPLLIEYKVVDVEQEITAPLIDTDVIFQARADAILQLRANENRYIVYSLKTNNNWYGALEESYKYSLQGITEYWAAQQYYQDKSIVGVKFCHLIKGKEREDSDSALEPEHRIWYTDCPLTRGWRKMFPTHTEYAHSFYFPNPENRSGYGRLGRGWERFHVHEVMGLNQWWNMIMNGQVQSDVPSPLPDLRISPPVYYKDENRVSRVMKQISYWEKYIAAAIHYIMPNNEPQSESAEYYSPKLDSFFPQNFQSCFFPGTCPYVPICHDPSVAHDPVGSGLYQIRVPHHEPELVHHIQKRITE